MIDTYFYNPTLLYDNTPQIVVTTPPTNIPVNVQKLKNSLRITSDAEVEELSDLIWDATAYIEAYTGRATLATKYTQSQRFFFGREIRLLRTPIISIDSVTYNDTNGTLQTVSPTLYTLNGANTVSPNLVLNLNQSWPTTDRTAFAMNINFTAGVSSQQELEPRLRRAIIMLASHLYNNREGIVVNARGVILEVPRHLNSFISQLRTKHV